MLVLNVENKIFDIRKMDTGSRTDEYKNRIMVKQFTVKIDVILIYNDFRLLDSCGRSKFV